MPDTASYEEVRDARIKLLKRFHPDLYAGSKDFAKLKTTEINQAFEALSNFFKSKCEDIKSTFTNTKKEPEMKKGPEIKKKTEIKKKSNIKQDHKVNKEEIKEQEKVVEKSYNYEDKEQVLKDLNDRIVQKEYNKKNGKKFIDISIYSLIILFVFLIFIMIFS